jgi:hypothetical protein
VVATANCIGAHCSLLAYQPRYVCVAASLRVSHFIRLTYLSRLPFVIHPSNHRNVSLSTSTRARS